MHEVLPRPAVGRPPSVARQRFILMIPHDLAVRVRKLAETERRPLNNQLQVLIERALRVKEDAL